MPESEPTCAIPSIERLREVMRQLRAPQTGCPWDLQQDFASIAPYTVEEAYEVVDAIEQDDREALCSELGDLLFQIVFHSQMAEEEGGFTFDDVVNGICEKLLRRHPHVFAGERIEEAELSKRWEAHKEAERRSRSADVHILDDVPMSLPALTRAQKLQKRAARQGFDWPDIKPVIDKIHEELAELEAEMDQHDNQRRIDHEMGDVLFSCVNLARHLNIDPEWSLRHANQRFQDRFTFIEDELRKQQRCLQDAELTELDALWNRAKQLQAHEG